MDSVQKTFFSWREAILESSLKSVTRHLLLTLSCHMNSLGEGCFPSTRRIARGMGVSERAVITHLRLALEAGWIGRKLHGFAGQRWAGYEYVICFPGQDPKDRPASEATERQRLPGVKGGEPRSAPSRVKGGEPRSAPSRVKGGEPRSAPSRVKVNSKGTEPRSAPLVEKGTERSDQKALNVVQHNKYPINNPGKVPGKTLDGWMDERAAVRPQNPPQAAKKARVNPPLRRSRRLRKWRRFSGCWILC